MRTITGVMPCLLLAVNCAQAQSNTKAPEILRGLKGVRLTVSFG